MPQYRAPGVYIEEVPSGVRPIAAVATGVTAIVGATPSGPLNVPVAVTSHAGFQATFDDGQAPAGPVALAVRAFFDNGGSRAVVVRVGAGGNAANRRPTAARAIGSARAKTGIFALAGETAFDLLLTPDIAGLSTARAAAATAAVIGLCAGRRAFALLELPRTVRMARDPVGAAIAWAGASGAVRQPDAAVYFPWIAMADPAGGAAPLAVSPNGALAGLFARTDAARGVWKAPAGMEARLNGAIDLAHALTDADMARLTQQAVNPLRRLPGQGIVAWGARSFAAPPADGEWRYVPVRRSALWIEESLCRGLAWTVFEPNDEPLWAQVRSSVDAFLNGLFRSGAFQGTSAKDAYFVRCDRTTMTAADIAAGRLNVLVGFAPLRPAEFVVLRLQLQAGGPP